MSRAADALVDLILDMAEVRRVAAHSAGVEVTDEQIADDVMASLLRMMKSSEEGTR